MGAIGGLLGTAGGVSGTGISGPSAAPISSPVTQDQINASQVGTNEALATQNAVTGDIRAQQGTANQSQTLGDVNATLRALQGVGGAGLQTEAAGQQQTLNTQLGNVGGAGAMGAAIGGQGALAGQLGAAGGIGAQTGAIQGLQGVAGQQAGTLAALQGIASGQGPNPAQAMLAQQTGANVANQGALMAGQRGAGANVGLMARQAAQQGAGIQQQAVGQGATMQANQMLGALGQQAGVEQGMAGTQQAIAGVGAGLTGQQQAALGQQFGMGQGAVGAQQAGIGQQFGMGTTNIGQTQAGQGLAAGIGQNMVGNAIAATGQGVQGNLANTGQQLGALGQFQGQQVGMQSNVNTVKGGLAQTTMQGQQGLVGGGLNAAGAALGAAHGGEIKKMAGGGESDQDDSGSAAPMVQAPKAPTPGGPKSSFGQFLTGMGGESSGAKALNQGMSSFGKGVGKAISGAFAPDEPTPATTGQPVVSPATQPGTIESTGTKTGDFLGGGTSTADFLSGAGGMAKGGLASTGGHVAAKRPSQKPVKSGDSLKNDKVPAMLSAGEVVIPRSVMQSDDPVRGAADFVNKVMARRHKK